MDNKQVYWHLSAPPSGTAVLAIYTRARSNTTCGRM